MLDFNIAQIDYYINRFGYWDKWQCSL